MLNKYWVEISKFNPLSREEELELFKRIKENQYPIAIEKICKHNLKFVVSVARNYALATKSSKYTLEDIINDGNVGLCLAITKFDHTRGFKFISYAVWYIRQCILTGIQNNIKIIRLPANIQADIAKFNKQQEALEHLNSRKVTIDEVIDSIAVEGEITSSDSINRMENMLNMFSYQTPLNSKISNDDDSVELIDMIPSDDPSPMDELLISERNKYINKYLKEIPPHVVPYIKDYFGLESNVQMTLTDIAAKYGKKRELISQNIKRHLRIIRRNHMADKEFFFH